MSESVLSRSIRGLGNALGLTGERSAPPGIELALPAQPVFDLTPLAQYGSAPVFQHFADGWVTLNVSQTVAIAQFTQASVADWSAVVSGDFGISQNSLNRTILWVYDVTLFATAATALADIGDSLVRISIPVGIGTAGHLNTVLFAGDGQDGFIQGNTLNGYVINRVRPSFPFPWAAGQPGQFVNQNLNANSIIWSWNLRCRILPLGVPPLP